MTPDLAPIPFDQFVADVHALADAVAAGDWRPDHLVGIGRGGLVPAAFLSHRTGIPTLSIDYSAGLPDFAEALLVRLAEWTRHARLLLVDDINDTGSTIAAIRRTIAEAGGIAGQVRVAVLIDNRSSAERVDYRAREIDRATDKRWFVFPWEAMAPVETVAQEAQAVPERLA